ncbi:MAG: XRE family transcriptional regulator [Clostridiales bacterium]|nr:XRE family transcriptional regulator [Clostridiales bacterium]
MKSKGYSTIAWLESLPPEKIKQRNLELYGSKIKHFRVRAGLSAEQLASALQISKSSVRNWECGLTRPDPEFLYRMFTILNVEPNEFFGLSGIGALLNAREQTLIDHYRTLDDAGKEDIETFAEALGAKVRTRILRSALSRMTCVADWGRFAAAGDGAEWPDHPEKEEVILFDSYAVSRADEIFTVSGKSMEPQFHDSDKVLVEYCSALRNGDIGIFYVPGFGGVIKQKAYDRLHSLNPDFDDIFPYEDGAQIVGRVVGKIEGSMIPGAEEQALYLEAAETLGE